MNKSILGLLLVFILFYSCKEKQKTYYDSGMLEAEYELDDSGKLHGEVILYYEEGGIKEIKQLKNGIANGEAIGYHKNGKVAWRLNYIDGLKTGKYVKYYNNGNLKVTSNYENGLQDGITTFYYMNKNVSSIEHHKEGKLHGITELFDSLGNKTVYAEYNNGDIIYNAIYDSISNIIKEDRFVLCNPELDDTLILGNEYIFTILLSGPNSLKIKNLTPLLNYLETEQIVQTNGENPEKGIFEWNPATLGENILSFHMWTVDDSLHTYFSTHIVIEKELKEGI